MKTDLNYIKKLIKMLDTSGVTELEIEEEGTRVKVVKNKPAEIAAAPQVVYTQAPMQQIAPPPAQQTAVSQTADEKKEAKPESNLIEVRSPIVGTFYRAPSPTADPYVQIGSNVSPGAVLCIIEAMKLMNEIESEVSGKIIQILAENGKPVEYNQVLFLVEPA